MDKWGEYEAVQYLQPGFDKPFEKSKEWLDALIREFTREIKAVHHGANTQDNLKRILREPISNMVHRALSETNTRFMINQFFFLNLL